MPKTTRNKAVVKKMQFITLCYKGEFLLQGTTSHLSNSDLETIKEYGVRLDDFAGGIRKQGFV